MLNSYAACLTWVLRHQLLRCWSPIGTVVLNVYLYIIVPKGFFPQQDTGRVMGTVQAAQDISFAAMKQKMDAVCRTSSVHDPECADDRRLRRRKVALTNTGRMFITLKPHRDERKISADQVIARLRRKLARFPGQPCSCNPRRT